MAEAGGQIAIEAVVGDVRFSADEPLSERFFPNQRLLEWLEPMQLFAGEIGPELRWIGGGFVPKLLVFFERLDAGALGERFRRREEPLFVHYRIESAVWYPPP